MSNLRDPARLSDLADAEFAELRPGLRDARRHGPSAEQRARMRAALGLPPIGTPGLPPSEPSPPQELPHADVAVGTADALGSRVHSLWLKLGLAVVVVAAAGFAVQHIVSPSAPETSHATALPAEVAPRTAVSTVPQPNGSAPNPSQTASPTATPQPGEPLPARRPRGGEISSKPEARRQAMARPRPAADPAGELALLKRARANARSAPDRALAAVAEHEARYPAPVFAEEREVIAVEALLAAGRTDQARRRAAEFFARFPSSAHTRRLHVLLEDDSDTKPGHAPHP